MSKRLSAQVDLKTVRLICLGVRGLVTMIQTVQVDIRVAAKVLGRTIEGMMH